MDGRVNVTAETIARASATVKASDAVCPCHDAVTDAVAEAAPVPAPAVPRVWWRGYCTLYESLFLLTSLPLAPRGGAVALCRAPCGGEERERAHPLLRVPASQP